MVPLYFLKEEHCKDYKLKVFTYECYAYDTSSYWRQYFDDMDGLNSDLGKVERDFFFT